VRDRAGYWEEIGASRMFLFTAGGLREATTGFDFGRVLRALEEAGAFTTQKGVTGERARKRRTPDGREIKLYHIDPSKLDCQP
jgi:putative DNA primase/helicase